jgi:hypothetical protein
MLTEEQQEQQERRPWQLHHKKSTSSGQYYLYVLVHTAVLYCINTTLSATHKYKR